MSSVQPLVLPSTSIKRMSVAAWIALPPHPRQRPTERHAVKAAKHNLSQTHTAHQFVSAVRLHGVLYKADGHTRAHLWKTGELVPPGPLVTVTIYECVTDDESNGVYDTFDSRHAAEDTQDRLQGALRFLGIKHDNPLTHDGMRTALNLLWAPADDIEALDLWRDEIELLSQVVSGPGKMGGVMIAAALASFFMHASAALPFWNSYRTRAVNARDGAICPVSEVLNERNADTYAKGSNADRRRGVQNILASIERWIGNPKGLYKIKPPPIDLDRYLDGIVVKAKPEDHRGSRAKQARRK